MLKKVLLTLLDNFEGYVSQALLAFFVLILLIPAFWAMVISYPLERAFAKHMPTDEEEASAAGEEDG